MGRAGDATITIADTKSKCRFLPPVNDYSKFYKITRTSPLGMVGAEGAKFHLTYPTRENFLFSSKIRISKNGPNFTGKHRNRPGTTQYSPRNDLSSPERTKRSFSESRFSIFSPPHSGNAHG